MKACPSDRGHFLAPGGAPRGPGFLMSGLLNGGSALYDCSRDSEDSQTRTRILRAARLCLGIKSRDDGAALALLSQCEPSMHVDCMHE